MMSTSKTFHLLLAYDKKYILIETWKFEEVYPRKNQYLQSSSKILI